jgi:hypothetical protein
MISTDELRRTLGPLGIWMPPPARVAVDPGKYAQEIEAAGQAYVKPYTKMARFLDALPATAAPAVLAALGPKMVELSRDRTAGAHPYFSPPEHTAFARQVLGTAPLLVPEIAVALTAGTEGAAHAP